MVVQNFPSGEPSGRPSGIFRDSFGLDSKSIFFALFYDDYCSLPGISSGRPSGIFRYHLKLDSHDFKKCLFFQNVVRELLIKTPYLDKKNDTSCIITI